MVSFFAHLILTAGLLLLMAHLVRGVQIEGWGICDYRCTCSRCSKRSRKTDYGCAHVTPHRSQLGAFSISHQRTDAWVDGGVGFGHSRSRLLARIGGKLGAHVAQSCRWPFRLAS